MHVSYAKESNHAFFRFMNDQVQRRIYLIEPPKPGYEKLIGKSLWMIDFEASHHMTGNAQLLKMKMAMCAIPVNLPNGANTIPNMEGSMSLSSQICFGQNCLCTKFSCNLISVA